MEKVAKIQKPTLKDIAREAKVSPTTVSLVLKDHETKRVSHAKRNQILKIAKKLNYRPNFVARNLVANESRTIGVVITTLIIPFYSEIAQDIITRSKETGYSVLISSTRELISSEANRIDAERQSIHELLDRGVDGLIICSAFRNDPVIPELIDQSAPFVLALRDIEQNSQLPLLDYVGINNQRGGYLAAEHLLRLGHRKIAIITGDMLVLSAHERLNGSLEGFNAYGEEPPNPDLILNGNYKRGDSYRATRELLKRKDRPTAILVHADHMAMGTLEALRDEGLRVPEDVALVGFDDIEMAGLPGVDLTTISQKKATLGKMAVEILIDKIKGKANRLSKRILLDPELVIRNTCGYRASGGNYLQ